MTIHLHSMTRAMAFPGVLSAGSNIIRLAVLAVLFLCVAQGNAQPPEPLQAFVAQLQKTPQDDTLREKLIRLAREMESEPAIPPEALRHENTGHALFKKAKTRQNYIAAAHEYEKALRHAPWAARLYFGLGEVYEAMADVEVGDRLSRAQIRQSCSNETRNEEWQRFDGYEQARKNFEYYLLAERNIDEQVAGMTKHRIEWRKLRIALWQHEWDTACCLGCGGKQDSKK